jgi:hypothetical protein
VTGNRPLLEINNPVQHVPLSREWWHVLPTLQQERIRRQKLQNSVDTISVIRV